jgi:pimeloyl-ACP methyl ester carboxylesterase
MKPSNLLYTIATGPKRRRQLLIPIGLIIFLALLAGILLGGLATDRAFAPPPLFPGSLGIVFGIFLIIPGAMLWGWCVLLFWRAHGTPVPFNPPQTLVTSGPFRYVRNPIVVGVCLCLFRLRVSFPFPFTRIRLASRVLPPQCNRAQVRRGAGTRAQVRGDLPVVSPARPSVPSQGGESDAAQTRTMKLESISKYPSDSTHSTPLLFVHGAFHAAWCWDVHFLEYFARHGFAAHAVSLRGHGNSEGRDNLRWTRIAAYVEDVAETARQLPHPPILIGHSMGGLVVQKVLESFPCPAAVLLASVPPAGVLATTLRLARRHPMAFAKANVTLSLLPLVATPRLAREAFFSKDLPEELLRTYSSRLQDESYLAFLDMLLFNLPKPESVKTPLLVLGADRDTFFNPTEIEATARAYNTRSEIIPDMAHDMMLESRWQVVAERILLWLKERELADPSRRPR